MQKISLLLLKLALGLVVAVSSLRLVYDQLQHHHPHHPLVILGVAEFLAAVLFLIPASMKLGGVALLLVFAVAAGFHILHHEYNVGFLAVYAAAALVVVAGGARRAR